MRTEHRALARLLDPQPEVLGAIREGRGRGAPLEGRARDRLERAIGADLGPVHVNVGPDAAAICRRLGVDGVAAGSDIFLAGDDVRLGEARGFRLLAHEAAHVAQQARVAPPARGPAADTAAVAAARAAAGATLELEADELAERVVLGLPAARTAGVARREAGPGRDPAPASRPGGPAAPGDTTPWLQGHGSWEHALFGDASVQELMAIAADAADKDRRRAILTTIHDTLKVWQPGTANVKAADLAAHWPGRITFQSPASGALFTYGELNALPDYVPSAAAIDQLSATIINKILQSIRQEGFNKIQGLLGTGPTTPIIGGPTMLLQAWLGTPTTDFVGAASSSSQFAVVNLLLETSALDGLTQSLGVNRYMALVARNACHFAPFSWYRWRDSFAVAQNLARQSHAAASVADRVSLAKQAWMQAGYAAHFLQDSFAAGHLVNKTLIMQWFVDWANGGGVWGHIPDWATLLTMTASLQPNIAAPALYTPTPGIEAFIAPIRDPQTAQEAGTRGSRMALSGTQPDGSIDELDAYFNFLVFLANPPAQAASGAVHDYFNQHSLSVASVAHPAAFTVWGDDTMLLGGEGIEIASETTHLSWVSIMELIETGQTDLTIDVIFSHFPTQAALPGSGQLVPLHDWQYSKEVHDLVDTIFPTSHYYLSQVATQFGNLSASDLWTRLTSITETGVAAFFDSQARFPNISNDNPAGGR